MSKYTEVSPEQARTIIEQNTALLLDVRDALSYKEGHIDGAMLAHDGLMESLIKKKEFDRPILVYCYHGISSKDTAEFFGTLGFRQVYSMIGGYTAWKKLAA